MKILLINQVFVAPDEPGHTRHFELAKYLQSQGDEMVIVASDLNYQTGKPTTKQKGLVVEQFINGVKVLRTHMPAVIHRSYFWRIIAFFSFMFNSVIASLKVKEVDLVMGTTPPIFQAFSAWLVSALKRKPFLLEVRDLWPEFIVSMGVFRNPLLIWLARRLEIFLYKRARHILVNSPAYLEYIHAKGIPESKITFIPYGADGVAFHPSNDGSQVRDEFNLRDKFVVLYCGALGQANDFATAIRAASHLQNDDRIRLLVVGDGKERGNLEKQATDLNLSNVIFAGTRPKHQIPQYVAAADVSLAILQNVPMFRTTYPNKVFDNMAAGKATILVIDGVIRQCIETCQGGVFVPPGDDRKLAETIRELAVSPEKLSEMGANARRYLMENLERTMMMKKTRALLLSLRKP